MWCDEVVQCTILSIICSDGSHNLGNCSLAEQSRLAHQWSDPALQTGSLSPCKHQSVSYLIHVIFTLFTCHCPALHYLMQLMSWSNPLFGSHLHLTSVRPHLTCLDGDTRDRPRSSQPRSTWKLELSLTFSYRPSSNIFIVKGLIYKSTKTWSQKVWHWMVRDGSELAETNRPFDKRLV